MLTQQGKPEEGERILRDAVTIDRVTLAQDHPRAALTLVFLGQALCAQGEAGETEQVSREALRINRAKLGDDHPRTQGS